VQELSHDLGDPTPPWLNQRVQDRPGVTPGEGGVTSHEEADQQSENYQFCLHSHCPENI